MQVYSGFKNSEAHFTVTSFHETHMSAGVLPRMQTAHVVLIFKHYANMATNAACGGLSHSSKGSGQSVHSDTIACAVLVVNGVVPLESYVLVTT